MPQQESVSQKLLARALYDNVAEAPNELAFRKGDLLTVLEQNTSGIDGWWLCVLRGRQGICPGNRLKIVTGTYANEEVQIEFNTLQREGKRRSWNIQPNKVLTPQKVGDVFLYDVNNLLQKYDFPTTSHNLSQNWTNQNQSLVESTYDIPPHPVPVHIDYANIQNETYSNCSTPPPSATTRHPLETYDTPRPIRLSPSSSISSLTTNSDSISSSSTSNRSSSYISEYDVPRSNKLITPQLHSLQHGSHPSHQQPSEVKAIPLELQQQHAQENLQRLEIEVVSSINKLINFATPDWRKSDKLEPKIEDIKNATQKLQTTLHDFTLFTQRCLGNASKVEDKTLYTKLNTLVNCLLDSDRIIYDCCRSLGDQNWDISRLSRVPGEKYQPDSLDQLIVICIKSLLDNVKHVSSFIQGNSPLLFKRCDGEGTSSKQGVSSNNSSAWTRSDEYIKLENASNEEVEEDGHYATLTNDLDKVESREEGSNGQLTHTTKQTLLFYAAQVASFSSQLTHSIDLFLQTVERNQPPKVFLSHGKFVVLNAYRLVYIGDAVAKIISRVEMKNKISQCCSILNETLATTVLKTRRAALQFPSVTAVQEMVDSVVDISHVARDLKIGIVMSAQQV